jgi:aldose 1-epimerase
MRLTALFLMALPVLASVPNGPAGAPPAEAMRCDRALFGRLADGTAVYAYSLGTPAGFTVKVMDLGATLTELRAPDSGGKAANVVIGFDRLDSYLARPSFLGATIGRFANRIAGSRFTLDGTTYALNANNGGVNHLHGGLRGFDKLVWQSRALPVTATEAAVEFTLLSPDGDEHYPGNLHASVRYTLTAVGVLQLDYMATTDRPTPVNLTNHSFFNLAGSGDILDHELTLNAARYTPVDAVKIPSGELAPVAGTEFDFSTPHRIGERMRPPSPVAAGYDHNYVLNGTAGQLNFGARLSDPKSGRVLEVWTTEPGVQFNTGNGFDGRFTGGNGQPIKRHAGCALETQHFPDSVNRPQFPSTILRPGEIYRSTTEFRFTTLK